MLTARRMTCPLDMKFIKGDRKKRHSKDLESEGQNEKGAY